MENNKKQTDNSKGGIPFALRLRSLKASRQSFARLLRERARGNISERDYKSIVWGLSQYLGYLKEESREQLEERVNKLETALKKESGR